MNTSKSLISGLDQPLVIHRGAGLQLIDAALGHLLQFYAQHAQLEPAAGTDGRHRVGGAGRKRVALPAVSGVSGGLFAGRWRLQSPRLLFKFAQFVDRLLLGDLSLGRAAAGVEGIEALMRHFLHLRM